MRHCETYDLRMSFSIKWVLRRLLFTTIYNDTFTKITQNIQLMYKNHIYNYTLFNVFAFVFCFDWFLNVVTPLVSDCPSDIVMLTTIPRAVSWGEPTAISRSYEPTPVSVESISHSPGSTFFFGSTEVSYVFSDVFGYEAVCTFMVTLSRSTSEYSIKEYKNVFNATVEVSFFLWITSTPGTWYHVENIDILRIYWWLTVCWEFLYDYSGRTRGGLGLSPGPMANKGPVNME